jgi:hypothetical protein
VLIAVHCVQRCKDTWFLHVEMGFEVEQYSKSRPPELENGPDCWDMYSTIVS